MHAAVLLHSKRALLALLVGLSAMGWLYVIYSERQSKNPTEIVKKHVIFYPEYSHGMWQEGHCGQGQSDGCRDVKYTLSVPGCGSVSFDWRVFPDKDSDTAFSYQGSTPKLNEDKYPLFAVLNADSLLIAPPAVGQPLPQSCQLK